MTTENERVQADIDKATKRIADADPGHRPPDPQRDGAKSLASAKEYSAQIKGSMFSNRNAPKS